MQRDDDVEIPSLTLDQDEVSNRRSNQSKTKGRSSPLQSTPHTVNKLPKKTNLFGVYFFITVVILLVCAAAYFFWLQNAQLREELYGAKSEIQNLDHQLLAADVSATEKEQTVEEKLRFHESEIRKLWGVSYDRNRKTIANNVTAIDSLKKTLASVEKTLADQSKVLADQKKQISIQTNELKGLETQLSKLLPSLVSFEQNLKSLESIQKGHTQQQQVTTDLVSSQAQALGKQEGTIKVLNSKLSVLESKVTELSNESAVFSAADAASIQSDLAKHQDAINSNDAFRTQINAEIIRLRRQINQLMLEQQLNTQ